MVTDERDGYILAGVTSYIILTDHGVGERARKTV